MLTFSMLKMFIQKMDFVNLGYFYAYVPQQDICIKIWHLNAIRVHGSKLKQITFVIVEYRS